MRNEGSGLGAEKVSKFKKIKWSSRNRAPGIAFPASFPSFEDLAKWYRLFNLLASGLRGQTKWRWRWGGGWGSAREGVLRFVCFPASFTGRYHTFICISTPSFGDPHGNLYLTSACKLLLNIADINHAGCGGNQGAREPGSRVESCCRYTNPSLGKGRQARGCQACLGQTERGGGGREEEGELINARLFVASRE